MTDRLDITRQNQIISHVSRENPTTLSGAVCFSWNNYCLLWVSFSWCIFIFMYIFMYFCCTGFLLLQHAGAAFVAERGLWVLQYCGSVVVARHVGSSGTRYWTSQTSRWILNHCATREVLSEAFKMSGERGKEREGHSRGGGQSIACPSTCLGTWRVDGAEWNVCWPTDGRNEVGTGGCIFVPQSARISSYHLPLVYPGTTGHAFLCSFLRIWTVDSGLQRIHLFMIV